MKIRSQVGMVLNLDKCIGCHTCSVTCKNVWTSREGMEYAWFNNVESKPGVGYPHAWEDQEKWKGGWIRKINGKLEPRMGSRVGVLAKIFANPDVPALDDYYEPFDYDYQHLHTAKQGKHQPVARPRHARRRTVASTLPAPPNAADRGCFRRAPVRGSTFHAVHPAAPAPAVGSFAYAASRLC